MSLKAGPQVRYSTPRSGAMKHFMSVWCLVIYAVRPAALRVVPLSGWRSAPEGMYVHFFIRHTSRHHRYNSKWLPSSQKELPLAELYINPHMKPLRINKIPGNITWWLSVQAPSSPTNPLTNTSQ